MLGLITLLLSGCAAKRPVGINMLIPLPCITKPVELLGCDDANPPKCKHAKVIYRKDCLQLEAK